MTDIEKKREEIRNELSRLLFQIEEGCEVTPEWWAEMCDREWSNAIVSGENADKVLAYLHSRRLRIEVDSKLHIIHQDGLKIARLVKDAGYVVVAPLIKGD